MPKAKKKVANKRKTRSYVEDSENDSSQNLSVPDNQGREENSESRNVPQSSSKANTKRPGSVTKKRKNAGTVKSTEVSAKIPKVRSTLNKGTKVTAVRVIEDDNQVDIEVGEDVNHEFPSEEDNEADVVSYMEEGEDLDEDDSDGEVILSSQNNNATLHNVDKGNVDRDTSHDEYESDPEEAGQEKDPGSYRKIKDLLDSGESYVDKDGKIVRNDRSCKRQKSTGRGTDLQDSRKREHEPERERVRKPQYDNRQDYKRDDRRDRGKLNEDDMSEMTIYKNAVKGVNDKRGSSSSEDVNRH